MVVIFMANKTFCLSVLIVIKLCRFDIKSHELQRYALDTVIGEKDETHWSVKDINLLFKFLQQTTIDLFSYFFY